MEHFIKIAKPWFRFPQPMFRCLSSLVQDLGYHIYYNMFKTGLVMMPNLNIFDHFEFLINFSTIWLTLYFLIYTLFNFEIFSDNLSSDKIDFKQQLMGVLMLEREFVSISGVIVKLPIHISIRISYTFHTHFIHFIHISYTFHTHFNTHFGCHCQIAQYTNDTWPCPWMF